MMHKIYRDQGDQPLVHAPPIRVTSATYTIEDITQGEDDADRVIGSGSATIDDLGVTLSGDSGRGTTAPRRINCVAPSAVRRRTYVLEEDGESELVVLEQVASSHVTAAGPLSALYTDAASLRGVELRATFPAAAAAREDLQEENRPLRVIWTYTIDGRTVRVREQIRVKRVAAEQTYLGAIEADIREDWPEMVQALPPHGNSVRTIVKSCARWVTARLKARGIEPEGFLAGDQGYQVLLARCLWRVGERGHAPGGVDLEQWREEKKADFLSSWRTLVVGSPGVDTAETSPASDQAPTGNSPRRRNLIARM